MQWHPVSARINLPSPWYYTLHDLAHEWDCAVDRIDYYLNAGLLTPCALVAKAKLPVELRAGAAPYVCVILDRYRAIEWQHHEGNATASLAGEFVAFYVDGEGFRNINFTLPEPIAISRADLVVSLDQREQLEDLAKPARQRRGNRTERAATDLVIKALAMKAYPDDIAHPYRVASKVCASLELEGASISRETVAQKLKAALVCASAKVTS
jgi:hypothetical protein